MSRGFWWDAARVSGLLCLVFAIACSDSPKLPPQPSPLHPPAPPAPDPIPIVPVEPRAISVGDTVQGVIVDVLQVERFRLTAPADGTVVATLTWDVAPNGTLLRLKLANSDFLPRPPAWSPVVGRLSVVSGQQYDLSVRMAGSDWLPNDKFTLSLAME